MRSLRQDHPYTKSRERLNLISWIARKGIAHAFTKRNVVFVSSNDLVGSGARTAGSPNFLILAGTTREAISARTTLHARTRAEMARQARSVWLNTDLVFIGHCPHASALSIADGR